MIIIGKREPETSRFVTGSLRTGCFDGKIKVDPASSVSGDRCGDAVGIFLSVRRRCNGRRHAERAGVTPRIARTILNIWKPPVTSAYGPKRTSLVAPHMSAYDPKRTWDHRPTRFVSLTAQDFPRGRWAHCRDRIGYLRTRRTGWEQPPPGAKQS
jgi:hypothetical protein